MWTGSMFLTVCKTVLGVKELDELDRLADPAEMVDGRATSAVAQKRNLQLPLESRGARRGAAIITRALAAHESFVEAAHPVAFSTPLFSRYAPGMSYPPHIDAAIMGGLRTDVAVTVFLCQPESYDGGELVINTGGAQRAIKLEAGDAVVYPASTFHSVNEVRSGVRFVAALWVQSLIREPERRAVLNRLSMLTRRYGHTAIGPRLHRSYWNLQRLWSDAIPQAAKTDQDA
jgi:PKHD-type hydroxylase